MIYSDKGIMYSKCFHNIPFVLIDRIFGYNFNEIDQFVKLVAIVIIFLYLSQF